MIYLVRGGEIAVLEDSSRLQEYEAQGWRTVSYEEYREAWRQKSTCTYESLLVRRFDQPTPPTEPRPQHIHAPCCRVLAFQESSGAYRCSSCKRIVKER